MVFAMNSIIDSLNNLQQEAVTYTNGPLLILAGAGSGKTKTLTHKAAYLIEEKKVSPQSILLLTFTNKAAEEMKKRVEKIVGFTPGFAGTFHSFCAKILRTEAEKIGLSKRFLIFDENDQKDVINDILKKMDLSPKLFRPQQVLTTISQAKNELISPLDYPDYTRSPFQKQVAVIYSLYQKKLKEQDALDFDDLLTEAVRALKNFPDILSAYQDRYRYILVDEWQDTNHAQYEMIRLLAKKYKNLCVVGDASQSIYSWRGADYRNITLLKDDFPQLKIVNLEQNYRSTQKILNAAFEIIKSNRSHPILKLWTLNQEGENVKVYEAKNENDEAQFLVKQIVQSSRPYSDFAVLYRTNAQSRAIEEVFLHAGLPYSLIGGVRFYERKEIKDVLAYLRYLANPKDITALKRIAKLGLRKMEKFLMIAKETDLEGKTTTEILDFILEKTGYWDLYDPEIEEDLSRLENIKELRSVASEFPDIYNFLENIALVENEYFPDKKVERNTFDHKDRVTLMTMHAAKGLEFPIVFIVGMEEGLFPHARTLLEPLEMEEERRLCYVAFTRAKEKLILSYSYRRLYFGSTSSNPPSRFISDLPQDLIDLLQ